MSEKTADDVITGMMPTNGGFRLVKQFSGHSSIDKALLLWKFAQLFYLTKHVDKTNKLTLQIKQELSDLGLPCLQETYKIGIYSEKGKLSTVSLQQDAHASLYINAIAIFMKQKAMI